MGMTYGYTRVSTAEQGRSGLGLDAQRAAICAEAARRGWAVTWVVDDGYSARSLDRPALSTLLATIERGDVLVAARLDRLSRSVADFVELMGRAQRQGWSLVVLDLALDTTTPMGEFTAHVLASVAQLERRLIGERTAAALAELKRRGVRLGCPSRLPPAVAQRVEQLRDEGLTMRAIAAVLNDEGVPSATGGSWWPSSVKMALHSRELDREAELRRDHAGALA